MDHSTIVDRIRTDLPEGFTADLNNDLGPSAFHIYDPSTSGGYGIYFAFALGFNTEGWEVGLDEAGNYISLPDGPGPDATDEEVAAWAITLAKSYAARSTPSRVDWANSQFEVAEATTYKIVRFYQDDRPSEVIKTGLSLDDAQAHCKDDSTHGEGWFDGYEDEA